MNVVAKENHEIVKKKFGIPPALFFFFHFEVID